MKIGEKQSEEKREPSFSNRLVPEINILESLYEMIKLL
tara:strand:- start:714 stop:827 length:114 start_codon:yes stop_codon:yes gene_type:complete